VTHSFPLTAVQHWFFEQELENPSHFNQAVLLEVRDPLSPAQWRELLARLIEHHEALRHRYVRTDTGWEARVLDPDAAPEESAPLLEIDVSGLSDAEREAEFSRVQASLNLAEGPLIRAALASRGAGRPPWLLLAIHHIVVDTVSWHVLLEDLRTLHGQLRDGRPLELPPKTTSFDRWARLVNDHVRSGALDSERDFWLERIRHPMTPLPVDFPDGENTEASAAVVEVALEEAETRALIQEVPRVYRTEINDVLMTALVRAFERVTGESSLWVNLEGHGREDIVEEADLLRTVGWFTSIFPVFLDLRGVDDPGEALKSVKEQLARVPNRGVGYGMLRYLSDDDEIRAKLASAPEPEVSFNYLGQFGQGKGGDVELSIGFAAASAGHEHGPLVERRNLVDVIGRVAGEKLLLKWTYSTKIHERGTIESLANAYIESLRRLIEHCRSADVGERTEYVAPRDAMSKQIADIWKEVLDVERVGVNDHFFFELGGNSIKSMEVMSRIRAEFGEDLPLRLLFESPTVGELVPRLQQGSDDVGRRSWNSEVEASLIPLQPRGSKPPLYLVSGAHADEDGFLRFVGDLLPHMGLDQPIYGFKARGLDGRSEPHEDAESMAADYVKELREFQPEGPYFLAGNCIGGVVAYEMAQQLHAQGQDVALTALLDTECPQEEFNEYIDEMYSFWKLSRFKGHWNKMRALSIGEMLSYGFGKLWKKLKLKLPMTEEARIASRIQSVEFKYAVRLAKYRPKPYGGKLTLVNAEELYGDRPDAGWERFARGGLESFMVPGDHVTRLSLNGGAVADILKSCIDKALAEGNARRQERVPQPVR